VIESSVRLNVSDVAAQSTCVIAHCAYSGVGGTGSLVSRLCPLLQRDHGVRSSVIFAGVEPLHPDYARRLGDGGVPYVYIGKRRGLDAEFLLRLAKAIKETGARKVVMHGGGTGWLYPVLRALGVRQRMILVEHGPEHGLRSAGNYARHLLALPWVDTVVCVAPHLAERVRALYGRLLRGKAVHVIPNGIDCGVFANAPGHRRPDVLAMVGTLSPSKDHGTLLEAFELLLRYRPLQLWLAGDGLLRSTLEKRASELGISGSVKFLGSVAEEGVAELLKSAAVFTFSTKGEGTPLAVLEAMAAGCPIVASDVPGVRGLVVDGVTGLLIPPGDPQSLAKATARLLDEPELASRFSREAKRVVLERYSLEVQAKRWAQLLVSSA